MTHRSVFIGDGLAGRHSSGLGVLRHGTDTSRWQPCPERRQNNSYKNCIPCLGRNQVALSPLALYLYTYSESTNPAANSGEEFTSVRGAPTSVLAVRSAGSTGSSSAGSSSQRDLCFSPSQFRFINAIFLQPYTSLSYIPTVFSHLQRALDPLWQYGEKPPGSS